jgi:nicotinamidase-related amidase
VRPALLVVDFSNAFTRGTERFPSSGFPAELAQANRLLAAARGRAPVLFTTIAYEQDMRDAGLWVAKVPWLNGLQLGSVEVEIDEALQRRADEPVLVKKFPSAFHGTDLHARLTSIGVDTLILAGCTTSCCVRATAVDAMQYGYRVLLAREAVGDFDRALHAIHLTDLGARYADVVPVDELIVYLREATPAGAGLPD